MKLKLIFILLSICIIQSIATIQVALPLKNIAPAYRAFKYLARPTVAVTTRMFHSTHKKEADVDYFRFASEYWNKIAHIKYAREEALKAFSHQHEPLTPTTKIMHYTLTFASSAFTFLYIAPLQYKILQGAYEYNKLWNFDDSKKKFPVLSFYALKDFFRVRREGRASFNNYTFYTTFSHSPYTRDFVGLFSYWRNLLTNLSQ